MRNAPRRLFSYVTSYNLGPKIFFSHLLVALAGTSTFVVVSFLLRALFVNPTGPAPTWVEALVRFSLAAGLSAAVAAATSLFVTWRITTPVRHMLKATRRIASGRYDERVPVQEPDELGALSESFNAMAAALQEGESRRREFISDVSHELGTPLSTLQMALEGLMDGVVEPSEENLGAMYAESERMRRLVDDLRQLSRAESGRLALDVVPVSPREPVGRAAEGMSPLFLEKGVELESEVPEGLPPVLADSDRVVQVLTNLLSNALRHTPEGGRVTVRAEAQGGRVIFEVRDTGAGITPEHLPRLFERFYRVEKSRSRENGGSGLGLAICGALIEAMGGHIWAESAGAGRGATFTFALPAVPLGEPPKS